MTNHEMHLYTSSFNMIKSGIKDIEYRLNDEKRQLIKIGDRITFYKLPDNKEIIETLVTGIRNYKNLLDMYFDSFESYLKDYYNTPEEVVIDTPYYSKEEIDKYGCVAIFFKKI